MSTQKKKKKSYIPIKENSLKKQFIIEIFCLDSSSDIYLVTCLLEICLRAQVQKIPVIEAGTFAGPQSSQLGCMLKQTNDKVHSKISEHELI